MNDAQIELYRQICEYFGPIFIETPVNEYGHLVVRKGDVRRTEWRLLPDGRATLCPWEGTTIVLYATCESRFMRISQLSRQTEGSHWYKALDFWRAYKNTSPLRVPVQTHWDTVSDIGEAHRLDMQWAEEMHALQASLQFDGITIGGL